MDHDHMLADLRAFEERQDRLEHEWDCMTVAEKCRREARYESHPLARRVLLAYAEHEGDTAELGRVISLFINDEIDRMY